MAEQREGIEEPVTADGDHKPIQAKGTGDGHGPARTETKGTDETPRPHLVVQAFGGDETAEGESESATDVVKKALKGDRETLIAAAIAAGIYAACLGIMYAVRYCATKHAVKAALREL